MYTIYAFQNKLDERVYIGQSVQMRKRLYQHRAALKNGKHQNKFFQRAWDKDGEAAFEHFAICQIEDKAEADATEIELIAWYKSLGLCYNHTKGGEGGNTVTPENKAATRIKLLARPKRVGWHPTEEQRKRMSEAQKKRPPRVTEEQRQARKERIRLDRKAQNKGYRRGENHPCFGKTSTDAQKAAASATWKGVKRGPFTEDHKRKIREARAKQDMSNRRKITD